ncbi:hypothetical protein PY32053_04626 (plasmid) [Paracoccus yeei]|uniref:Uncharacterized protein n=1 Tax=Paracoccus yeei TaxID=147645 RepID=A0A386UUV6_9RHOB|nr:hypothetical protein PY32053_04626 [Paracoccus yeei]
MTNPAPQDWCIQNGACMTRAFQQGHLNLMGSLQLCWRGALQLSPLPRRLRHPVIADPLALRKVGHVASCRSIRNSPSLISNESTRKFDLRNPFSGLSRLR